MAVVARVVDVGITVQYSIEGTTVVSITTQSIMPPSDLVLAVWKRPRTLYRRRDRVIILS
jgi:hypothetical protein